MKIVMVCGSPRVKDSTSMYVLNALKEKLEDGNEIHIFQPLGPDEIEPLIKEIPGSDILLFAFPLYIDSIPSHLLEVLTAIEGAKPGETEKMKACLIVNNGFYDAVQNGPAIDIFWNWCDKCGIKRGCAIGLGAGEMTKMAPLGQGPCVNLGNALQQFVEDIRETCDGKTTFVEPNFPRFLYKAAAHFGWRKLARGNGLRASDIRRI